MTDSSIIVRGIDQLGALLADIAPADLDAPTPCSQWSVRDLADHVVHSVSGMATMARGGEVDWSAPAAHHDDPASAFREAGAELTSAIGDAGDAFPQGMAAGELAVHAWDLATALGRDSASLDPEIAEAGYAFMSTTLTDDQRHGAFDAELPAPEGADPYQRLAAFAGRTV